MSEGQNQALAGFDTKSSFVTEPKPGYEPYPVRCAGKTDRGLAPAEREALKLSQRSGIFTHSK